MRGPVVRLVIEKLGPIDDGAMAHSIERALSIAVEVAPLFPNDPDLQRFRRLTVPNVSRPDRADLFETADSPRSAPASAPRRSSPQDLRHRLLRLRLLAA